MAKEVVEVSRRFVFAGGTVGQWRVNAIRAVIGDGLAAVERVAIIPAHDSRVATDAAWAVHGQLSNVRYATRSELTALRSKQEPLGRASSRLAAMIPIKKNAAWWDLAQDERRAVFEQTSQHISIGMSYLPAVARQLYHCRDLGEPFDFVTWFEYGADDSRSFEELVTRLRATREWDYVEREIDIRLELVG